MGASCETKTHQNAHASGLSPAGGEFTHRQRRGSRARRGDQAPLDEGDAPLCLIIGVEGGGGRDQKPRLRKGGDPAPLAPPLLIIGIEEGGRDQKPELREGGRSSTTG